MTQQDIKPVHWAHVNQSGEIVTWGTSHGTDVFLQNLEPGLIAIARPQDITGWSGHVYQDGEWKPKETTQ